MIKWAGYLIIFLGAGHLLAALILYAPPHFDAWFSGQLWGEDLADMSDANAAFWLTLDSFSIPTILIGLTILWMDRRNITPPTFLAWTLAAWTILDLIVFGLSPGPVVLVAATLLVIGARRANQAADAETLRAGQIAQ